MDIPAGARLRSPIYQKKKEAISQDFFFEIGAYDILEV
jgi:hypothetical protein